MLPLKLDFLYGDARRMSGTNEKRQKALLLAFAKNSDKNLPDVIAGADAVGNEAAAAIHPAGDADALAATIPGAAVV